MCYRYYKVKPSDDDPSFTYPLQRIKYTKGILVWGFFATDYHTWGTFRTYDSFKEVVEDLGTLSPYLSWKRISKAEANKFIKNLLVMEELNK